MPVPAPTPTTSVLLKKSVATIALWPLTGSITYTAKLTYNSMVMLAQHMKADAEGGFSVAVSQIVKAYGSDTRYSGRVRDYIRGMVGQRVQWTPLAEADVIAAQAQIEGVPVVIETRNDGDQELERVFTLLAEARFFNRSGELWVTYFFPPSIRAMILDPTRYALVDVLEQAKLSTYSASTLFEICCRYRDVPGGRTNRAPIDWWANTLRGSADSKPREWRKFKHETLNPALAEISQRTGLSIELLEHKQGRAVTEVQFQIIQHPKKQVSISENIDLIERAEFLRIPEDDVDRLVDFYGRERVEAGITALENRVRAQPLNPVQFPSAYLEKSLKNDASKGGNTFAPKPTPAPAPAAGQRGPGPQLLQTVEQEEERLARRAHSLALKEISQLTDDRLDSYAAMARARLHPDHPVDQSLIKRFDARQYRSGLIWGRIAEAYALAEFGPNWIAKINEAYPCDTDGV